MISYIEATYTSRKDQPFTLGQIYCLEVRHSWFGTIVVTPVHGYQYKPLQDMRCKYANLRDFLLDWQPGKVLDPYWHENLYE